ASRVVERSYDQALAKLGPELCILQSVPVEDIAHAGSSLLAEAVTRLRSGQVIREAGYDGEYGTIHLFDDGELKRLSGGSLLFEAPSTPLARAKPGTQVADAGQADSSLRGNEREESNGAKRTRSDVRSGSGQTGDKAQGILAELDDDQRAA